MTSRIQACAWLEITEGARRHCGERQALGRLPWFAPFFLRDFLLRPRLLMVTPNGEWLAVLPAGPDWCSATLYCHVGGARLANGEHGAVLGVQA